MKIFCALFLFSTVVISCGPTNMYSYRFQKPEYTVNTKPDTLQLVNKSVLPDAVVPEKEDQAWVANKEDMVIPIEPVKHKLDVPAATPAKTELTKEEKRVMKKELRTKVKEFKKAVKAGDAVKAEALAKEIDYYLKMGIVIGAAGLILLIIGSFTTGVLTAIGAIALVVGLVLIILYVANN